MATRYDPAFCAGWRKNFRIALDCRRAWVMLPPTVSKPEQRAQQREAFRQRELDKERTRGHRPVRFVARLDRLSRKEEKKVCKKRDHRRHAHCLGCRGCLERNGFCYTCRTYHPSTGLVFDPSVGAWRAK